MNSSREIFALSLRHCAGFLTLLFLLVPAGFAEPPGIHSQSGQFVVSGRSTSGQLPVNPNVSGVTYLRLDAPVLATACERIKRALLFALDANDQWRGKIFLNVHPVTIDNEEILIEATHYLDGWNYRVDLPEQLDGGRFLNTLVEVLVREIVNRRGGARAAELPPWLVAGLAAHLTATAGAVPADPQANALLEGLVPRPMGSSRTGVNTELKSSLVRSGRRRDPFQSARAILQTHAPLTLDELDWPTETQRVENPEVYQACAQLLVSELLRLKRGPQCFRVMLEAMPDYLNWQTAFLLGFREYFPRRVDADKWWSVSLAHFTGRDELHAWPREESWRQLDDVLRVAVQVRTQTSDLPLNARATLQTIITEWDFPRQAGLLQRKLNQLQALRLRVTHELVALVDDYRMTLAVYLQKREGGPATHALKKNIVTNQKLLVADILRKLDALDALREQMRQETNAPTATMKQE